MEADVIWQPEVGEMLKEASSCRPEDVVESISRAFDGTFHGDLGGGGDEEGKM